MTLRSPEAAAGTAPNDTAAPAGNTSVAAASHSNTANMGLGVSIGALIGVLIGVSVLPGVAITFAPISAAVIGGFVGYNATRIAAKFHSFQ